MHGLQDNAVVLCRQLGFDDGFLYSIEPRTLAGSVTLAPPWLGGFRCGGNESAVLDCQLPGLGNTVTCGPPQRLFCSPVGALLCDFIQTVYACALCTLWTSPSDLCRILAIILMLRSAS